MTHPADLLADTQLPAGLGVATVLPDLDFESYSEAGCVFDYAAQKWIGPPGARKGQKGLPVVGAACYATHPTTEVLSLAYNLKDGRGPQRWHPGQPQPADLIAHVQRGGILEAWNSAFEWWMWNYVCVPKYGWPPLPIEQTRCAMAKARASGYPGALEKAGAVMRLTTPKDDGGKALLNKLSIPRNPTAKDKRLRLTRADAPEDFEALDRYNDRDILAEAEASSRCPDLTGEELEFWLVDQRINRRGVAVDVESLHACAVIVEKCLARYDAELHQLTGGAVERASQLERLKGWLAGQGVFVASGPGTMDEEGIEVILKTPNLPAQARRALEIRQMVGSASVKKVFAMRNQVSPWGRLHDLFNYHGARTGRPTGEGPQPTNLPKAGPDVKQCVCGRHSGAHLAACAWCGLPFAPGQKRAEWGPDAMEDVLAVIKTGDLSLAERAFADAMLCVSGCLRGLFWADEGKDLIASDFSSIEGVVTACLAGEDWRVEMFATHGKAYELSVSKIAGIPFAEIMAHAGYDDVERPEWWKHRADKTKPHHPLRQTLGKVAELACFTAETEVLTNRGYVDMVGVLPTDLLWDGVEWVKHQGVIPKGKREVISLDGIEVTPNHPICLSGSWKEARLLASSPSMLAQALAHGSANLPLSKKPPVRENVGFSCNAVADESPTSWRFPIYSKGRLPAVNSALQKLRLRALSTIGVMRIFAPTTSTAAVCSIEFPPASDAATTPRQSSTQTMAGGAFWYMSLGGKTSALFSRICSLLRGGTARNLSLTAETLTAGTPLETCDSLPSPRTQKTSEKSGYCNCGSRNLKHVFDIAHAGPRNRFTIRTRSGHLLVHNSGFGGWINAWKRFGADAFMNDEEIKTAILAWREASPAIVELWGGQERRAGWERWPELFGLEGMAISAVLTPGQWFHVMRKDGTYSGVSYICHGPALYCWLPSGRALTYHNPVLSANTRGYGGAYSLSFEGYNTNPQQGPVGWVRIDTYSGKLAENCVQAVARDIQRYAMINLEKAGYPVVLHVYDEDVVEVPKDFGSIEEVERIMGQMPPWATYKGKPWPIRAAGGFRGRRYRKE